MPGGLLISYSNLSIREKYVLARIKIIRLLRIIYEKYILNFSKKCYKKMKRISKDLSDRNNHLSVVIVGVDEFWDVALLKFIYEYSASSISFNSEEMMSTALSVARCSSPRRSLKTLGSTIRPLA